MKLITIVIFLLPIIIKGQDLKIGPGFPISNFGYRPSKEFDTSKVIYLCSQKNNEGSTFVKHGYVVRQEYVYFGDAMPGGNYEPEWREVKKLDLQKKDFLANWIVWDYRFLDDGTRNTKIPLVSMSRYQLIKFEHNNDDGTRNSVLKLGYNIDLAAKCSCCWKAIDLSYPKRK